MKIDYAEATRVHILISDLKIPSRSKQEFCQTPTICLTLLRSTPLLARKVKKQDEREFSETFKSYRTSLFIELVAQ